MRFVADANGNTPVSCGGGGRKGGSGAGSAMVKCQFEYHPILPANLSTLQNLRFATTRLAGTIRNERRSGQVFLLSPKLDSLMIIRSLFGCIIRRRDPLRIKICKGCPSAELRAMQLGKMKV